MDASGNVSAVNSAAGVYAFKKGVEVQSASVTQLLNSVTPPQPVQYTNPPALGNSVDIKV